MTTYAVQFQLPVDKPENNVRLTKEKHTWIFDVPINHPDAHNMGYEDLIAAAELSGRLVLLTTLNNKKKGVQNTSSKVLDTRIPGASLPKNENH